MGQVPDLQQMAQAAQLGAAMQQGGQVALAIDPGAVTSIIADRAVYMVACNIYTSLMDRNIREEVDQSDEDVREMACQEAFKILDAFEVECLAWNERRKEKT